jgi:hypothetical protein
MPKITIAVEPDWKAPTRNTARKKRAAEVRVSPMRFVCIDGESARFPSGEPPYVLLSEQRYVLLGCGTDYIVNEDGLTWHECFEFLYSQFQEGGVAYTGFFLGFDFTQWLKSFREERARKLLTAEGRARRTFPVRQGNGRTYSKPVDIDGWQVDILGTKRLKIRPEGKKRWMYICDTGPFFQKSLLKVIDPANWTDPVVTAEEYDRIAAGKANRSSALLDSNMIEYNAAENEILSRVLERLDKAFRELDIHLSPKQWFGPGQAAQTWLDKIGAPNGQQIRETVPYAFLDAARKTYYGGRFELFAHGIIPGEIHENDINSAYPDAISKLPCLLHGTYRSGTGKLPDMRDGRLSIVRGSVRGKSRIIGPLPHREDDGSILYPQNTEGWFWLHEILAAQKAGLVRSYKVREWLSYEPCDCPPPLEAVKEIYALRKRVDKNSALGIACKLVPNSLYGKFAQSIGEPRYGNPVYASLITSACRIKILEAIGSNPYGPEDVMMIATDGIYSRHENPNLRISKELGDWDHDVKTNMTLFKPGVYWDDKARTAIRNGDPVAFKARGVNARDFAATLHQIDAEFIDHNMRKTVPRESWPAVTFPISFTVITAVQALQRNDWSLAGKTFTDLPGKQSSDPRLKRCKWYRDDTIIRSEAKPEGLGPNYPYEQRFGIEDPSNPFSQIAKEENGVSEEGLPGDIWKEILYDE